MTIYEIAEMVGILFPQAFTPSNIQSGFRVSGIFPFNLYIFTDGEYLCSYVTDRIDPSVSTNLESQDATSVLSNIAATAKPVISATAIISI